MSRTKGHALRASVVAIGALALGAVLGGTANASPLGGLGGGDHGSGGNHGYGSGVGDVANGDNGYDDNDGYSNNGYRSAFGRHGAPGMHNGLMSFDVPDVETK